MRSLQTIECTLYNETVTKTYKTFLATYVPAGCMIRVVLVKEKHAWYAFYCTDPDASVLEILEAFADRATIEQDFHDVKEVWGSGQQAVTTECYRTKWTYGPRQFGGVRYRRRPCAGCVRPHG